MRNIANKQDNVDVLSAAEFNGSIMEELENAVTASGQTLDPAGGPDTDNQMLAQSITRTAQGGVAYQDGGAANAYVLTAVNSSFVQPGAYFDGMTVIFQAGNSNTAGSTVNVASLGAKDIVDVSGSALVADSIVANTYYMIQYDLGNDRFILISFAQSAAASLPAGIMLFNASTSVPAGYFECDGSAVSRTTYAALFASIGTTWGVGDGSTTFNLPDFRGEFPRGWDNGRGVDSGRSFASFQSFAMQNITGTIAFLDHAVESATGAFALAGTTSGGAQGATGSVRDQFSLDASNQVTTATETRPRNVAAMFIIKF